FPSGLLPAPTDEARPAHGVIVLADNEKSRKGGLQAGDIIVGPEGWRVEDTRQYQAINAFYEKDEIKIRSAHTRSASGWRSARGRSMCSAWCSGRDAASRSSASASDRCWHWPARV